MKMTCLFSQPKGRGFKSRPQPKILVGSRRSWPIDVKRDAKGMVKEALALPATNRATLAEALLASLDGHMAAAYEHAK